jgi:hypothetical protein
MHYQILVKMNERERVRPQDTASIHFWCNQLNCTESELMYCISKVGTSIKSIESYLYMNRTILQKWVRETA